MPGISNIAIVKTECPNQNNAIVEIANNINEVAKRLLMPLSLK